jgi:hypothetical protein
MNIPKMHYKADDEDDNQDESSDSGDQSHNVCLH